MRKSPINKYNLLFAVVFTVFPIVSVGVLISTSSSFSFIAIAVLFTFFIIGVSNWVAYIKIVKAINLERKIKKEGVLAEATFIQEKSNIMINTTPVFSIKYCWKDANENYFENESMAVFYDADIEWFKRMKTFKIKYIGRNSAIVDDMEFTVQQNIEAKLESEDFEPHQQNVKYCPNCGIKLQNNNNKCPICGYKD